MLEILENEVDAADKISLPDLVRKKDVKQFAVPVCLKHFELQGRKDLLTDDETLILQVSTFIPFSLETPGKKYETINEILDTLGVAVHIEPGIHRRTIPRGLDDEEKVLLSKMPLRGLYDPEERVIKLFPEEMKKEYKGERMNELLVSTLAHEAMHAYFDRNDDNTKKYIYSVEEPLAEFGMLLFLKETKQEDYYRWALDDVSSKRTRYRYGAALMNQHLRELAAGLNLRTRRDLESYEGKLF